MADQTFQKRGLVNLKTQKTQSVETNDKTMELANKVIKVAIKVVIKMQGQMSIHCVVHLKLIYFMSNIPQ